MRYLNGTLLFVFILLSIGCRGLVYRAATHAMAPIDIDDACSVNPFEYSGHPIERFDIVVYEVPDEAKRLTNSSGDIRMIKRIIGLPGEKVEIRSNQVFINDELLTEPFEKIVDESDRKKDFGPIRVPENEYFLLGDNRPNSEDSRWYPHPTIRKENIFSKVTNIYKGYYKK